MIKNGGEWRRKTFVNQNKNENIEGDKNGLALCGTYMVDKEKSHLVENHFV